MKKAIVLCMTDPSGNPRPNRIIKLLDSLDYLVDFFGPSVKSNLPLNRKFLCEYERYTLFSKILEIFLKSIAGFFSAIKMFKFGELIIDYLYGFDENDFDENYYDVVVVENIQMLPMAFRYARTKNDCKIVFDAREYYPKEFEMNFIFKYISSHLMLGYCRKYLKKCDILLTVSEGLSKKYMEEFGVFMHVLRSTSSYKKMPVNPSGSTIRMVHHGIANPDRCIENMIEIVKRLDDRFTLDFYLTGSKRYINFLKSLAGDFNRIKFNDPVSFDQILPTLNNFDIGLYYLEPKGFNVTYNLPNKFFEFIQARLALAIGPSPEMKYLVEKYQCGIVSGEFTIDSIVKALRRLSSDSILSLKHGSENASHELSFEYESIHIRTLLS